MEFPRLGVKSELQLSVYTTATATWDLSCVCDLYHSSRQCPIPDPLSEARHQTCILMDTSQIGFCCTTTGTPVTLVLLLLKKYLNFQFLRVAFAFLYQGCANISPQITGSFSQHHCLRMLYFTFQHIT